MRRSLGAALIGCAATVGCQAVSGLSKYENVDAFAVDAGAADAPPDTGPPCTHTFCASFDQGAFLTGWKTFAKSGGATLELDTTQFRSAPASLVIGVPQSAGGTAVTKLSQSFAVALKGAHLELEARIAPVAFPDAGAGVVRLATLTSDPPGPTPPGVAVVWSGGGLGVAVTSPSDGGPTEQVFSASTSPAPDTWVKLRLDVVFSDSGAGSVKLTLDGAVVVEQTGLTISASGASASASALELGLSTTGATPAFRANYDNVTLDLDP